MTLFLISGKLRYSRFTTIYPIFAKKSTPSLVGRVMAVWGTCQELSWLAVALTVVTLFSVFVGPAALFFSDF